MKTLKKRKVKPFTVFIFLMCILVALIMIVPFFWMLCASFKPKTDIFTVPIKWLPESFYLGNYERVVSVIPFLRYFLNTLKVTVSIVVLQVITCSMAAYAFSKLHFPGRDKLFLAYLGTMMIPWYAIMIPQFIVISRLGLYNTHWALILTGAFSAFGVFIMRQNMLSVPDSLCEAAKIDGCGPVGIFLRIVVPLSKSGLATLVILTFNSVWNDYMGPMIYLDSEEKRTIQLGLATFKRQYDTDYGSIMAGTVLSLIPIVIVYAIGQKYIVEGISYTGLKD